MQRPHELRRAQLVAVLRPRDLGAVDGDDEEAPVQEAPLDPVRGDKGGRRAGDDEPQLLRVGVAVEERRRHLDVDGRAADDRAHAPLHRLARRRELAG